MTMDRTFWSVAVVVLALAGVAASAAEPARKPAASPAGASPAAASSAADAAGGSGITDEQFDKALAAAAAETQGAAFTGPLQSVAPRFREVPASAEPGKSVWHKVTLNTRGRKIDAVRFRVPEGEARGMAWAFIPPANLSGWYIIPTSGETTGFTKFFRPSARNVLGAKAPEGAKQVLLQSLGAAHLKPGGEYILWFRFRDEKPAPLYLTIALPPGADDADEFDEPKIVKALGLTREGTDLGAVDLDTPAAATGTP